MTAMTNSSWARVRGPLAPYAAGFRVELERLGYMPLTAATHVRLMADLSRWLARECTEAPGLTPAVVMRISPNAPRLAMPGTSLAGHCGRWPGACGDWGDPASGVGSCGKPAGTAARPVPGVPARRARAG